MDDDQPSDAIRLRALELAFLALTGSTIRDEGADSNQSLRNMAQMWRKKR